MVAGTTFEFKEYVAARRQLVESTLGEYLSADDPPELWESMRYSVLGGGKRLRAILCLSAAEAVGGEPELALPCACAIELVHAMSLIHDDLPCLDNDDLRRGRPTNHKVFGEAMALLAGDALLMLASEILIARTSKAVDRGVLLDVAAGLARAAGASGMVGGQVVDIAFTGRAGSGEPAGMQMLESMHRRKTGALIRFSIWSGARLAGADEPRLSALGRFGEVLGLAFQIADDLLDVTGDAITLGKTPGKDEASKKTTWVSLHGVEASRAKLAALEAEGRSLVAESGLDAQHAQALSALLAYAIHRTN